MMVPKRRKVKREKRPVWIEVSAFKVLKAYAEKKGRPMIAILSELVRRELSKPEKGLEPGPGGRKSYGGVWMV